MRFQIFYFRYFHCLFSSLLYSDFQGDSSSDDVISAAEAGPLSVPGTGAQSEKYRLLTIDRRTLDKTAS